MRITDFLRKENCIAPFTSTSKEDVLREMCGLLLKNGDITDIDLTYEALVNRERLSSTGIGDHIAIPHAKTAGVSTMVAAFGINREGIEFYSVDDKPVRLIFMLMATKSATGAHLKALARISRLLKRTSFRNDIENLDDPVTIYERIVEEDEILG